MSEIKAMYIGTDPENMQNITKIVSNATLTWAYSQNPEPLMAERVIFHPPATIVYWNDGTKTVVKCSNEEYDEEKGLTMAWMRKVYGSRSAFLRAIREAERPQNKKEK